jgi:hypothetical protein
MQPASRKSAKVDRRRARRLMRKNARPMAEMWDRHELYQMSVQDPVQDVRFLIEAWQDAYGREEEPRHLREDFCGTALLATHWAQRGPDFTADGVDLDPECLQWGRTHNLSTLSPEHGSVELHEEDVRVALDRPADVRCAQNFSWQILTERSELLDYLRRARAELSDRGIFVMDMFGGSEAVEEMEEEREVSDDITYIWDQVRFEPVTGHTDCAIHFRFADGSEIDNAFEYSWRLYTPPEVTDILREAGFSQVRYYFETFDEDGDGTGVFAATETGESCEGWLAYVVAIP